MPARPILALLAALGAPASAQGIPPLGDAPLSAADAAAFFDAVCLASAPSFEGARRTLKANGLAPNPETGTFYHPALDLSFHVDARCSMVFSSPEAPSQVGLAFAASTLAASGAGDMGLDPTGGVAAAPGPGGTLMTVGPFTAPDGASYFRALLEPAR